MKTYQCSFIKLCTSGKYVDFSLLLAPCSRSTNKHKTKKIDKGEDKQLVGCVETHLRQASLQIFRALPLPDLGCISWKKEGTAKKAKTAAQTTHVRTHDRALCARVAFPLLDQAPFRSPKSRELRNRDQRMSTKVWGGALAFVLILSALALVRVLMLGTSRSQTVVWKHLGWPETVIFMSLDPPETVSC